jgi:hypothetical protein
MPQAAKCLFLKDKFGRLESGYIEGENYKFFQRQQTANLLAPCKFLIGCSQESKTSPGKKIKNQSTEKT